MEENKTNELETKKEPIKKKGNVLNTILTIIIILSIVLMVGCSYYIISTKNMIKKYDVDTFKLDKYEVTTLNGVLRSNKKLIRATSKNGVITLNYDAAKMSLNNIYEYLQELSSQGYEIVNLEEKYIRLVKKDNVIQVRIKILDGYVSFEYKIGIDYEEKSDDEKNQNDKENIESDKK